MELLHLLDPFFDRADLLKTTKTSLRNSAYSRQTRLWRPVNSRCSRGDQWSKPYCHKVERRQKSYLFAEAKNCRSSGIDAQSLPVGSRKRASSPDGLRSGQPRNLPRQSIPCLRTNICPCVGKPPARRNIGKAQPVAHRAAPECSLPGRWRYRDAAYPPPFLSRW